MSCAEERPTGAPLALVPKVVASLVGKGVDVVVEGPEPGSMR